MATIAEVYQLLEEKENDLHLAAELGKALLERNESLNKEYERMCKDYNHQMEKLKTENIWLRGQLSKHSEEWEEVMREHNEDIQQLREQLSHKAKQFASQTQSMQEMTQLAQQNQRLTLELDKALESEETLKRSLTDIKTLYEELQVEYKNLSVNFDDLHLSVSLSKKKLMDSEQKVKILATEKEKCQNLVDELSYKKGALEREKQDMMEQVRLQDKQIELLKEKNMELFEQLQDLASNPAKNSPSFLEELEYSQKSLTSGYSSNLSLLDELESDDAITLLPIDNFGQLKMEVLETYGELQSIVEELESSECASTQSKAKITASRDISNGELISTAKHVKYLVTRRHQIGALLNQVTELRSNLQSKTDKIESLESELTRNKRNSSSKEAESMLIKVKEENIELQSTLSKIKDELKRTKEDNRKLERELLETIQKKIKLSQQVEQWQLDMEEMVENQVRCMFILEQQNKSKTLMINSTPSTSSLTALTSPPSSTTSTPQSAPEVKQNAPFNRNDKRRFSLFGRRSKD